MRRHPLPEPEDLDLPADTPGLPAALALLLQAHDFTQPLPDPWQFPVAWNTLQFLGLAEAAGVRLVERGYVLHQLETTPDGADRRTFRPPASFRLGPQSRLVLTPDGVTYAQRQVGSMRPGPGATPTPCWKPGDQTLWFRGRKAKIFRFDADNQRHLLQAFEDRKWQPCIDNPFAHKRGCRNPKSALPKAAERLNEATKPLGLRFRWNKAGLVTWEEYE